MDDDWMSINAPLMVLQNTLDYLKKRREKYIAEAETIKKKVEEYLIKAAKHDADILEYEETIANLEWIKRHGNK